MATMTQRKPWSQVKDEMKEFMWNPRTKEFMGRTGSSWGLILTFYMVFYGFLTAIFCLSMWVMLQTMNDYTPKYEDRLANPGLMFRPFNGTLDITYTTNGKNGTWNDWVAKLDNLLTNYNQSVQDQRGINCTAGDYFRQDTNPNPKKACQFTREQLGDCSGIGDTTYGYANGTPCVLIKINRVINFLPTVIQRISNTSITINCTAKNDALLGPRVYFPSTNQTLGSIDLMYFPYYGNRAQPNYTQPYVAVKFLNATRGIDHIVECRVNAGNIVNTEDRDKFQGRVIFTLRINPL